MVTHLSRNTDKARRTFGLKPCRDIHHITVDISAIWNHIADIDADAEADGSIRGLVNIVSGDLLLNLQGTAYRSVDAVEHDEQRIAPGVDNPSAMLRYCRVDQICSGATEAVKEFPRRLTQSDGCSQPCPHGPISSRPLDGILCESDALVPDISDSP